jgi:glycosyltransferase involved in cell wall biosynthesis
MQYKILFISSWFPNKIEPTNGNFVQRHAEAVATQHQVEILHAIGDFQQKENYIFDEQIINNIKTLVVYYKNTKNPVVNFLRRMNSYRLGFQKMTFPDLVHANVLHNSMLFAVFLKKKFKIPFVVTEHWTALRKINQNNTAKNILKIAKIIGNQANYILPVSNDLKLSLQNLGIKTPIKVIPNVVDTVLFQKKEDKNEQCTFIHVSNLIPRKNADRILSVALELLDDGYDFCLKLGGDGDEKTIENLKKTVRESKHSDKIEIFGLQTIQAIAEKMKASDCFILFSKDENQPCVIAESFASGLQIISTAVGGISEFLPKDYGVLLPKTENILLKNAMVKILQQEIPHHAEELRNYAQKTFSVKAIANQFSEIYTKVLQK